MSAACDPASDDWARHFFFTKDDGYMAVSWVPKPDELDDGRDQLVRFIDAGDSVPEVLAALREFVPKLDAGTGRDDVDDAEVGDY